MNLFINRLKLNNQKGQALVEMALILPLLLLLLFGIFEFSRIYSAQLIVTHSAREGARAAAVGTLDAEVEDLMKLRVSALSLNPDLLNINIAPAHNNRSRGESVSINIEYPVKIFAPIISRIVGNPYVVKSEVTMRVE